jgi:hypothetical protein
LQSSLKAATVIRADEHKTFQGEEAELMEAANMLTQAYAVLKRSLSGPSFLQEDRTDSRMTRIVNALSLLISAAGSIDSAAASKVKAFLEAEDSLSLKQPQAVVRAYESKSGGILDAIEELQEKAAQNLSALRSKEMDSKHAFEVLSQDLKNRSRQRRKPYRTQNSSRKMRRQLLVLPVRSCSKLQMRWTRIRVCLLTLRWIASVMPTSGKRAKRAPSRKWSHYRRPWIFCRASSPSCNFPKGPGMIPDRRPVHSYENWATSWIVLDFFKLLKVFPTILLERFGK